VVQKTGKRNSKLEKWCLWALILPLRSTKILDKYVHLRGRSYIHTSWHMPILCPRRGIFLECRISIGRIGPQTDFGLFGEQSSPKWQIPCLGRRWTAVQNKTPLALSSEKKFINVQTRKKQTVTDISTPCRSACVDNNCTARFYTDLFSAWHISVQGCWLCNFCISLFGNVEWGVTTDLHLLLPNGYIPPWNKCRQGPWNFY